MPASKPTAFQSKHTSRTNASQKSFEISDLHKLYLATDETRRQRNHAFNQETRKIPLPAYCKPRKNVKI